MKKTRMFLIFLILSAVMISYPQEKDAPDVLVTRINDSTFKLYVSDYVDMYAFTGPDGTLLIDTGYKIKESVLRKKLLELKCRPVKYIINTHSNGDHIGGNHLFRDAVIIAHQNFKKDLEKMKDFPKEGFPDLTFKDALTLHFNSEIIRISAMPGGHTDNDIVVHMVNSKMVFLGDIIVPDTFPVIWLDHFENVGIKQLVSILQRLINSFPDDITYISSHGRDYTKDDLRKYYKTVVETIGIVISSVRQGKTLEQIKKENILQNYRSFDSQKFKFINADFWIETIYKDLKKKPGKGGN